MRAGGQIVVNGARPPLGGFPPPELIRKYDRNGPRYTSYPTALQFGPDFGPEQHRAAAALSNALSADAGLSLYAHIPFCASPCFYCACTKIITSRHELAEAYLQRLVREIGLQGRLFPHSRRVEQLHFGGGTPTYFSMTQLARVLEALRGAFNISTGADREFSIEIDPRTVAPAAFAQLAELGFNRASFGIQDFDPEVQKAVNREQSWQQVAQVMDAARHAGFRSLSADLIYGLPRQTRASFSHTLDQLIALQPDRVSTYSYAHLPQRFKAQRRLRLEDLPNAAAKLELLYLTVERLLAAGYVYIGMDHFALPQDELTQALHAGSLQRNFQGYSTRGGLDLLGLGMSAISRLGAVYSQNARTLGGYQRALDAGELAVDRGVLLSPDDCLRREVISSLMCSGRLRFAEIERRYGIGFDDYFARELREAAGLEQDGLIVLGDDGIEVTARGRYLLRSIAMPFDAYLQSRPGPEEPRFSRAI